MDLDVGLVIYLIVITAIVAAVWLGSVAARRGGNPSEPPEEQGAIPPWFDDPFLEHLYNVHSHVVSRPMPTTPDDLLAMPAFTELVRLLSASHVKPELHVRFVFGEDAVLSWAGLVALAKLPADAEIEGLLLRRMNDYHPWTRHFMLLVLEAWHPEDPQLAGRVLANIVGPTWDNGRMIEILESFLARRAAAAPPLSMTEAVPAPSFSARVLRGLLDRMDPKLVEPLGARVEQLMEEEDAKHPTAGAPGIEQRFGLDRPLDELGRVTEPGKATAEGVLASPSADLKLEAILAALRGGPPRSVVLVGEPGVGKTALLRRAAARLSQEGWTLFEASAAQINAGMMFTGSLEGRVQELILQLRRRRILWIVPDFPQLLWTGRHVQSPIGLLDLIAPALESGSILMLAEARPAAMDRVLGERPEIVRQLELIRLEPTSPEETETLLEQWSAAVAQRKGILIPSEVRSEAGALARQYLASELPPGGVLHLLGAALAPLERADGKPAEGMRSLAVGDLVGALAQLTGLPLDILDERSTLDLGKLRQRFEERVLGQPEAVSCLVERLALLKAGITDPNRPTGVFLFVGGSGTGKTELARTLAEYLFGSAERLLRLDMSEMQDASALERLFGDPRSLESRGASLVERVRRQPFSVVLLDEFDRAHPRIWDLFLQVFDAGRLTDHRGETADFRHTIIILTSNLGTASAGEVRLGLLQSSEVAGPVAIQRAVERAFRPEMLNRFDQVVPFRPLTRDVMSRILRKELADAFERRGLRRRAWSVELEESAIELLVARGFSPKMGARPLKRALESLLLTPLAAAIVNRKAPAAGQFLFVRADGDRLAVEFVDPEAEVASAPAPLPAVESVERIDVAAILFEAHGSVEELAVLHCALAGLQQRIVDPAWSEAKERLLLECAEPGFWERPDRFERLGRAEYMDRIENVVESATSLFERLHGGAGPPRTSYPREMVRRLAQQVYLVDAACAEALETGPRDAFLSVEAPQGGSAPRAPARDFARRLAEMYAAWARARGMRLTVLPPPHGSQDMHVLAISGFAAYRLLVPEIGLHVLEYEENGRNPHKVTVRVRVVPQPMVPARDGSTGLRRQAEEALQPQGPLSTAVVRRYREGRAPLVRDFVRGWRTGRIERVLGGDFDVVPVRE